MEVENDESIRGRAKNYLKSIFHAYCEKNINMNNVNLDGHVNNLEKGIFNWSIQYAKKYNIIHEWSNEYFNIIYKNKVRSIGTNLSKKPELIGDALTKKTLVQSIAFMTHMEMDPDIWNEIIQQCAFNKQRELETTQESMTDAFECRKCHSRKTTYYQMQTRSADEPMTVFVSCLVCGCRWKC